MHGYKGRREKCPSGPDRRYWVIRQRYVRNSPVNWEGDSAQPGGCPWVGGDLNILPWWSLPWYTD